MEYSENFLKNYVQNQSLRKYKTIMRYHVIPIRMAIIIKTQNNKCWSGCEEIGTLACCWWGCKTVQTVANKWYGDFLTELPHDPAVLRLGIYSEEVEAGI